MSYKATSALRQTKTTEGFSKDSPSKTKQSFLAPEENWDLVGNPSVLFDELPQPYKFINNCLNEMIMKPVAAKITEIEERKKTTEYEGFIKEASSTGSMDINAVTLFEKISSTVGPGGVIDKEN